MIENVSNPAWYFFPVWSALSAFMNNEDEFNSIDLSKSLWSYCIIARAIFDIIPSVLL